MPILIKNFCWSQTKTHIIIRIPINEANARTFDIFIQENYVKIHCVPYLFEVFLLHNIIEEQSCCKILENEVKVILKKTTESEWVGLEKVCSRVEQLKSKHAIIENAHVLAAKESEKIKTAKYNLKQEEIHKEIARESSIRTKIENICKDEYNNQMRAFSSESCSSFQLANIVNKGVSQSKYATIPTIEKKILPKKKNEKLEEITKIQPTIRAGANIQVKFTNRRFSTPQRESQAFAEQEWLIKQHEARKTIGTSLNILNIQLDPLYCLLQTF